MRHLTVSEKVLIGGGVLAGLHLADHVLRNDYSGWPFTSEVTPFTFFFFLVYPSLLVIFLARSRPRLQSGLMAILLAGVLVTHTLVETPAGVYRTWANGVSSAPESLGQPNLLELASPALGVVAVSILLLLVVAIFISLGLYLRAARSGNAEMA